MLSNLTLHWGKKVRYQTSCSNPCSSSYLGVFSSRGKRFSLNDLPLKISLSARAEKCSWEGKDGQKGRECKKHPPFSLLGKIPQLYSSVLPPPRNFFSFQTPSLSVSWVPFVPSAHSYYRRLHSSCLSDYPDYPPKKVMRHHVAERRCH